VLGFIRRPVCLRAGFFAKNWAKKKAASISCLKAMKTIKQCSENRKLETIK